MKQIKLGAFLPGSGQHIAAWRHPDSPSDGNTNIDFYKRLAQTAERGLFDAYFLADNLTIIQGGEAGGSSRIAGFEPVTLFAALAPFTKHLGFIATTSTTYEEPFNVARKFASLDLISNGRAGWNVVTSAGDDTARNFNLAAQPAHGERYARAREHVEVVKALWTSWDDDAFIRDKATGRYYDPKKLHTINFNGNYFNVMGPLNVPRSPQGHPVIVQAGQSNDGRRLAADTAEVVFTVQQSLHSAQEFYSDLKSRVSAVGRNPEHVLVLPGIAPFIGSTRQEADDKYAFLNDLILPEDGIALLNRLNGNVIDFGDYPLDGPLPQSNETEGQKSRQAVIYALANNNGLTIRQAYQWIATARGHFTVIGTPKDIADTLEEWFLGDAGDGFNIMPPWLPGGLDDFVSLVVPELQRRGLFRHTYEGRTLRENLGLPYPRTD